MIQTSPLLRYIVIVLYRIDIMATKHVILALLDIKPMSGYDLFQNLKISVYSLWAATYSQIYPTLHKLEDEGMIKGERMLSKKNRERIEYGITNKGKKELNQWINSPVNYLPYRDPFKLWATNIDVCSWEQIESNIKRHKEINTDRKKKLEAIVSGILNEDHPLIGERKRNVNPNRLDQIKESRALIFKFLVEQANFEIETADKILEVARKMQIAED